MVDKQLFKSEKWDWETPQEFFDKVNEIFHFDCDAAATPNNTKVSDNYITPEMNSLETPWVGMNWLNPPWGKAYKKATKKSVWDWMAKALTEYYVGRAESVCLIPARPDTRWWHSTVVFAPMVCFVKGRIHFLDETGQPKAGATFPSALVMYVKEITPEMIQGLSKIGWLVKRVKIPLTVNFG